MGGPAGGVHVAPQTAQGFVRIARSATSDFFAISKISGEITGSAEAFFFIAVFTIEQPALPNVKGLSS